MQEGNTICVLCRFHHQTCLFLENPQPRKRRNTSNSGSGERTNAVEVQDPATPNNAPGIPTEEDIRPQRHESIITQETPVADYANMKGPSLLKRTLGLQNHRHSFHVGASSEFEPGVVSLNPLNERDEILLGALSLRNVNGAESFLLKPDQSTSSRDQDVECLDKIEAVVAPHGQALARLYFRIVHPSFPILHKRVFLEKYARSHREFSPPLLAAVYMLALNWWSYSSDLALFQKPDFRELETLAVKTMSHAISRPKLSTIQAGLLLLQRPEGDSWALTGSLVAIGQDLGLHLDCSSWRIPSWERGLRKRLGWALFMQDKWGALMHGRPSHISAFDWMVEPVGEDDFPERAAEEDEEEGSTEVDKGRILFGEMIRLTEILAIILSEFYTLNACEEFKKRTGEGVSWVLEKAKPIQIRLKEWFSRLPDCLRMDGVKMKKLNSVGYLHLAYYAVEMTLHRRIIRSLVCETNASLVRICRVAAQARLSSATDFVCALRPEHLQSFWYSSSKYSLALVGTFISLLWVTALTKEEANGYKQKLEEYRWTLRLSSKSAEIIDRAIALLTMSTGMLVKAIPMKRSSAGVILSDTESHIWPGNVSQDLAEGQTPSEEGDLYSLPESTIMLSPDDALPVAQSVELSGVYSLWPEFLEGDQGYSL